MHTIKYVRSKKKLYKVGKVMSPWCVGKNTSEVRMQFRNLLNLFSSTIMHIGLPDCLNNGSGARYSLKKISKFNK